MDKREIICPKNNLQIINKIVSCSSKNTLGQVRTKHKDGSEIKVIRKIVREDNLNKSSVELPYTLEEFNFDTTGEESKDDYSNTSTEESGGLTPQYVYETLEETEVESFDHDYSHFKDVDSRKKLCENQEKQMSEINITEEINQNILQNESIEEYGDIAVIEIIPGSSKKTLNENRKEVTKKDTIQNLSRHVSDEECEEGFESEMLPQQIFTPFQPLKQYYPLQTSASPCDQNKTLTSRKRKQDVISSTPKPVSATQVVDKNTLSGSAQKKRVRVNEKFPEVPVPSHINQYGECLKTRLGRYHYGLTISDPPCQFFQGVLKGASGQTLAAMFGDVNLFAKLQGLPLDEVGHFMIDTTFTVPQNITEGVNRLFTISLLHQNVVIPLWYAVTSGSSPELYKRILIEFQQHFLDWPFTSVLADDDPILCKAIKTVFPDVELYGSWFHYCYGIWKELNRHNLTEQTKTEDSLLKAVKLLMVVPYLPPSNENNTSSITMAHGFEYVRDFAKENNLPKEFNRVLDYVAAFWFNKVKPKNFTLFGKHTNALNYVEVFQLLLLSYMKQDGNVWTLTRSFQTIARSTYSGWIKFLNGKRVIPKKTRGKRFNLPIRVNMKKLMARSLDVRQYLEKSTVYLEEILDILLHPLYPVASPEKTDYIHTEGWATRICSD